MSLSLQIRESDLGATFAVRIRPRAGKTAITGTLDGALKIAVSAPPLEGRANDALVEFLSGILRVPRSAVEVISGVHARNKVIRIVGCPAGAIELALRDHFMV